HCRKCPLGNIRKNIVFGSGSINAKLMFVGEAPGHEEDIQGVPFVGEAGALLTKIIEAMAIKRDDVYICNILKCRPPQNRNPLPEEISMCIDYLYAQIDAIKPKVICGLGKFASQTLLNTETPISKLRGKWHEYRGMKFMPTYHPAYLLRNPKDKKLVWEDMKKIMEIYRAD
ncbi:MAG: DNA polymerase, partial [Candidatus Omnitrophica bacterium CG12_big_fil_rev_8_21_14_0_65_42_8]